MPKGTKLSATPFDYVNVQNAESFVGLTLSKDGESVEVCQLLKRSRITLEAMRRLIHGLCRDFAKLRKSTNLRKQDVQWKAIFSIHSMNTIDFSLKALRMRLNLIP